MPEWLSAVIVVIVSAFVSMVTTIIVRRIEWKRERERSHDLDVAIKYADLHKLADEMGVTVPTLIAHSKDPGDLSGEQPNFKGSVLTWAEGIAIDSFNEVITWNSWRSYVGQLEVKGRKRHASLSGTENIFTGEIRNFFEYPPFPSASLRAFRLSIHVLKENEWKSDATSELLKREDEINAIEKDMPIRLHDSETWTTTPG